MNLATLAYKNLQRRKLRTCFTIIGIALSTWVLVTLLGFNKGYESSLNHDIENMGFQIVLTAKGCPYEAATLMLKGGTGLRYMEEDMLNNISGAPEVNKASPMLMHAEFDPNKGENGGTVVFLGVDRLTYPKVKPYFEFSQGNWFSSDDSKEIVLGYEAAELEQREVGDEMLIPGSDEEYKVVGILKRTGTQDDGMIMLPLKTLQNSFNKQRKLTMIGIQLKKEANSAEFEEKLYQLPDVQVVSMAQVKNTIISLVKSARVIVMAIACIAFLIAVFGVLNTVMMSVFERYQEIGILKSIGALPIHIFIMIWIETIFLCSGGSLIGIILSYIFANGSEKMARVLLPFVPNGTLILISLDIILIAFISITLTGMLGGIIPAIQASRIRPLDAIRRDN